MRLRNAGRDAWAAAWLGLLVVATAPTGWSVLAASRGSEVPSSPRSRAVERRVAPKLRRALAARGLRWGAPVLLRIFKEERELELWLRGRGGRYALWRAWPICAWSGRLGPKLREGDGQSPEGFYRVRPGRMNPRSRFHLSFDLGFPNAFDRAHGRTGSVLMVHGGCASAGCYAMTDPVIEEIWTLMAAAFRRGQRAVPVHAFPARLTEAWLREHEDSRWIGFWRQLAAGYEAFERTGRPPRVHVRVGRYVVVSRFAPARARRASARAAATPPSSPNR